MAKRKFTAEQMIAALRETKGMTTIAATRLGCDYTTVLNYIRDYPSVAAAQKEAREQMGDAAELKLYSKAVQDGDTTALIFLLKTQFKRRGYVERSESVNLDLTPELTAKLRDVAKALGVSAGDLLEAYVQELARVNQPAENPAGGA